MQPSPINITIPQHQRSPQQPQAPRSLLASQPGPFDWLAPRSIAQAMARLLVAIGGGLTTGAIARAIPWQPETVAITLLPCLAGVVALAFLWRSDRRGAWILLAYALFGAVGAGMAIGFGGDE